MAETMPTTAEQLAALKKELALAKAISGGPASSEPAYRYIADPPGKAVLQAYMQEREAAPKVSQALPIFYVELPPLEKEGPSLIEVLSRALSLPIRGKWKERFFAEERLGEQLRLRQVELTVLTDAHYLNNRPHGVEWLVSFFRNHLESAPLLLLGEGKQMDDLLLWKATAWVIRRWSRIRLPGEPEEPTSIRADLNRMFDMKDDSTTPEE